MFDCMFDRPATPTPLGLTMNSIAQSSAPVKLAAKAGKAAAAKSAALAPKKCVLACSLHGWLAAQAQTNASQQRLQRAATGCAAP